MFEVPIQSIPNELLYKIWEYSGLRETHKRREKLNTRRQLPPEVLLSHVSKRWRNLIVSSPSAWTHITYTFHASILRVEEYVARSKHLPISILIDFSSLGVAISEREPLVARVMAVLTPHMARWMSFQCFALHSTLMQIVFKVLCNLPSASCLTVLRLCLDDSPDRTDAFRGMPFGGIAPRLECVQFSGFRFDWACPFLQGGLKILQLGFHDVPDRPSVGTFRKILRASPDLEALSLRYSGPAPFAFDEQAWPLQDTIELPKLRRLELWTFHISNTWSLFRRLVLPTLDTIELQFDTDNTATHEVNEILHCLARPHPSSGISPLRSVRAFHLESDRSGLVGSDIARLVLQELINVRVLSVGTSEGKTFAALKDGPVPICPALKLYLCNDEDLDDVRVVRDIRDARAKMGVPLRVLLDRRLYARFEAPCEARENRNCGDERWELEGVDVLRCSWTDVYGWADSILAGYLREVEEVDAASA